MCVFVYDTLNDVKICDMCVSFLVALKKFSFVHRPISHSQPKYLGRRRLHFSVNLGHKYMSNILILNIVYIIQLYPLRPLPERY